MHCDRRREESVGKPSGDFSPNVRSSYSALAENSSTDKTNRVSSNLDANHVRSKLGRESRRLRLASPYRCFRVHSRTEVQTGSENREEPGCTNHLHKDRLT